MTIQCQTCKHVLSTEGKIPRFCSACGSPLGDTQQGENSVNTWDPSPNANFEATVALPNPTARGTASRIANADDATIDHGSSNGDDPNRSDMLPEDSFVGPFKIICTLGQGGMGTVYKAVHSETGQTVALKLLSRSVRTTEETIQRFQRESQIAASINHPRSTFVYQAGQHQGRFYITMELMTGGTLTDVVRDDGPIPFAHAVDHVLDIISGLQSAHHVGIVHRDLKPSNCFVDERGRVKIGDYGLAKSFLNDSSLTQTGAFMGTPQYAAPEQLRASVVDERADIYAIGGTLFYLLTGRAPFVGNAAQVIASITSEKPPKVDSIEATVPRELSRIINQTLEKDPARRPENLEALRQSLLPYSTRGISSADIGRRMAAFFIDIAVIFLMIMFASQFTGMFAQIMSYTDLQQVFLLNIFVALFASVGYFALLEWQFGTTFGKWLLGMRVITDKNQSPGMMGSLIRATLLPGVSYLLNAFPAYVLEFDPFKPDIWVIIELQVFQILSWIPCLICFVSARKNNGMRGLHEILSGTRVVRLAGALEYKRPKNVPVTAPVALDAEKNFNDFTALGTVGRQPEPDSLVLLGRDLSLDRDVWIVDRAPLQPDPAREIRKSLARPTRLRILDEKIEGDHCWLVTEAIKGMPLVEYVTQTPNVDWRSFRPLLRELTYELAKAQDDSTVPTRMSLASVWLDQAGRVKLLDQPITPLQLEQNEASESLSDLAPTAKTKDKLDSENQTLGEEIWLSPFALISGLLDHFIENQVVPAHVLTFQKELEIVRAEPDSLRTIGKRLGELADQPSSWRWDDRMGVMAISIGIEYATSSSVASTIALAVAYFLDFSFASILLLMVALGSLTVMLLGAFFGGGPIFQLSGVLVRRNKTLEPASPFRCAFRNWITWLPLILLMACVAVVFEFFVKPGGMTPENTQLALDDILNPWLIGAVLLSISMLAIMALAPIYAIFKPSRGIPDVISGTRLIRK